MTNGKHFARLSLLVIAAIALPEARAAGEVALPDLTPECRDRADAPPEISYNVRSFGRSERWHKNIKFSKTDLMVTPAWPDELGNEVPGFRLEPNKITELQRGSPFNCADDSNLLAKHDANLIKIKFSQRSMCRHYVSELILDLIKFRDKLSDRLKPKEREVVNCALARLGTLRDALAKGAVPKNRAAEGEGH